MDTTLETVTSVETSLCATGNCPLPTTPEVELSTEEVYSVEKGDIVLAMRNGKLRVSKAITKGKKNLGLDTYGMTTNYKIPVDQAFTPITVFVTDEVATYLETSGKE